MVAMTPELERKFSSAKLQTFMRLPYYAPAIKQMRVVFTSELPYKTMAVTPKWVLMVHPEFVQKTPVSELAGVIVHEVNHLIRAHAARGKGFSGDQWNAAADLEINDDIMMDLPEGALLPEKFGFEAHRTAEYYYNALGNNQDQDQEQDQGGGDGDGQEGDDQENGQEGEPSFGDIPCGGGAGNPIDKELEDRLDAEHGVCDSQIDQAKKDTAKKVKEHIAKRGQGSVGADLREWAEATLAPPVVPWRQILRRTIASGVKYVRGNVQANWGEADRRTQALNRAIGVRSFYPGRRSPNPKITFAIDTSGSMGDKEVGQALSEIHGILKTTRSSLTVMSADARICKKGRVSNLKDAMKLIGGGGGTDFRPVFDWLENEGQDQNILVYATDGLGAFPEKPPKGVKVVWILVGPYTRAADRFPFGEVIDAN